MTGTPIKLLGAPLNKAILGEGVTFNCMTTSPFAKLDAGSVLWVRERLKIAHSDGAWMYAHDRAPVEVHKDRFSMTQIYWSRAQTRDTCSATHMPRFASRVTLEVLSIRVRGKIATVLCRSHRRNIDRIAA